MMRRRKAKPIRRQHGMRGTPEWHTWQGMKRRCSNPNRKDFSYYGGRGIKVCHRWAFGAHGRSGFQLFFLDMGRKPSPEHTLDRIDNNGDYTPTNCKWSTRLEQSRNRRGVKLNVARVRTIKRSNEPLKALADRYGCTFGCVWNAKVGLTWSEVRA